MIKYQDMVHWSRCSHATSFLDRKKELNEHFTNYNPCKQRQSSRFITKNFELCIYLVTRLLTFKWWNIRNAIVYRYRHLRWENKNLTFFLFSYSSFFFQCNMSHLTQTLSFLLASDKRVLVQIIEQCHIQLVLMQRVNIVTS